ncbi:MAG: beta-ketoacyl-ACP synthase III [Gammaproteobacteria bacterium]|nr:beta-ketoacyl-ACP synthase III [Gammaproteobacteria bacterium]
MSAVVISGSGIFTPPFAVSNDALVSAFNARVDRINSANAAAIERGEQQPLPYSSSEFIDKASGIKSRFLMDAEGVLDPERLCPRLPARSDDEPSLMVEMALVAARDALVAARVEGAEIDLVIVAASNLERAYPAIAVELQQALGAGGYAFDMNVACASATFALSTAADAISCGAATRALLVNPEICSAHANFADRDSHFIFGDGCAALVVEREDLCRIAHPFVVGGRQLVTSFSNNIRNNAGFLGRCRPPVAPHAELFRQNGRKVFKEVLPLVVELIEGLMAREGLSSGQLARLWLHQANSNMNQFIARKVLGREPDEGNAPTILDRYGNTSSAGSVIAFHLHHQDLVPGSIAILCAFGAGYSAGAVVLRRR